MVTTWVTTNIIKKVYTKRMQILTYNQLNAKLPLVCVVNNVNDTLTASQVL